MRTLSCIFQLMIFIEQPAEIRVHLFIWDRKLMLMGNTLPVRHFTHLCNHFVVCVSLCVIMCECTERCLTFPLCWEQISVVPLPGRASSTVHSSLLLSGEACCASMRLEGVTAPTIQGCRKHKPETGGKCFGTSWSKSYDGTVFVEKVVWSLISNNLNFIVL